MPRSGPPSYTYTLPAVYLAIPGTTITTAQHNEPLEDIADTFNSVQPVVWGGTGSSNAAGARANLGLSIGTDVAGIGTANIFTQDQTIRKSDDGATAGPLLTLDRLSTTPAASDLIGRVVFAGRDDGGASQTYGSLDAEIVDPAAGTEDGRLLLQTVIAGTLANRAYVGAGIYTPNAVLADPGADRFNAVDYMLNGVSLFPDNFLSGCTIANNSTDATNDIDFSSGKVADSTNVSTAVMSAMTKRLDADWQAGTGNGMRYSGAAIANTTYHLWAIWKPGGVDPDWYADPSADPATVLTHIQAETGGSAYAYLRWVGPIMRASSTIRPFVQDGDTFWLRTPVNSLAAVNPGTSAVTRTLTAIPLGIVVTAILVHTINDESPPSLYGALLTDLSSPDVAPSTTVFDVLVNDAGSHGTMREIRTSTAAEIRSRIAQSAADVTEYIVVWGFRVRR